MKYKPTGNKDLDRALIKLQAQVDSLILDTGVQRRDRTKETIITSHQLSSYRITAVNDWFVGANNVDEIDITDFAHTEMRNVIFISPNNNMSLKRFSMNYSVSSTVAYEMKLLIISFVKGQTYVKSISKGKTISLGSLTSNKLYKVSQDLNRKLKRGDCIIPAFRYTSGSGSKYFYGDITLEFERKI